MCDQPYDRRSGWGWGWGWRVEVGFRPCGVCGAWRTYFSFFTLTTYILAYLFIGGIFAPPLNGAGDVGLMRLTDSALGVLGTSLSPRHHVLTIVYG